MNFDPDFSRGKADSAGPSIRRLATRMEWDILPNRESTLLLAVSGGADSVFLVRALAERATERRWVLLLAHVHHGVRGDEADADRQFVEDLARELDIPCFVSRLEPYQLEGGASLEGRLRLARWGVLAALARAQGCDAIVAGHHRDDLAETFLLQALRGAGLTGLGSLEPRGKWDDVDILRPLLPIGRDEIRDALSADGYSWREDRTNLDRAFKRNWLRLDILPALEARQKGTLEALARTARVAAEESAELQRQGREQLDRARPNWARAGGAAGDALDWDRLCPLPPVLRRHALRAWIHDLTGSTLSPSYEAISDVERAAENARASGGERFVVSSPGLLVWTDGRRLLSGTSEGHAELDAAGLRDRVLPWLIAWRRLWNLPFVFQESNIQKTEIVSVAETQGASAEGNGTLAKSMEPSSEASGAKKTDRIFEKQAAVAAGGSIVVRIGAGSELLPVDWREQWDGELRNERIAVFDLGGLEGPITVAPPAAGDCMAMKGGGHKDVLQALAEAGVPEILRDRIPVVYDAEGSLWIPGIRRAGRAWVSSETPVVLVLSVGESRLGT